MLSYKELFNRFVVNDCETLDIFLDKYRKSERYKLRDAETKGYSILIKENHIKELEQHGITWIGPYESNTGKTVAFINK